MFIPTIQLLFFSAQISDLLFLPPLAHGREESLQSRKLVIFNHKLVGSGQLSGIVGQTMSVGHRKVLKSSYTGVHAFFASVTLSLSNLGSFDPPVGPCPLSSQW